MALNNTFPYEADELDTFQNGPVGAHRTKPSAGKRLVPYLVVIVVAVALAFVAVKYFADGDLSMTLFQKRL
jgi:hypothetical protein